MNNNANGASDQVLISKDYLKSLQDQVLIFQQENEKLQDITHAMTMTLQSLKRYHRKSTTSSNTNQLSITDFFTENNTSKQPSISRRKVPKMNVISKTIRSFVNNEGQGIFKLKYDESRLEYKFYCHPCRRYCKLFTKYTTTFDKGQFFTDLQVNDEILFYDIRKKIQQHCQSRIHEKTYLHGIHCQSINKQSPILCKIETVYHMLLRSSPIQVFEELMGLYYRLSKHLAEVCGEAAIDIGDICHSRREAEKIIKCFMNVLQRKLFLILQLPASTLCPFNLIFYSFGIDGWSKGMFVFSCTLNIFHCFC